MLRVKEVIFLEKDHTNQLSKSSQSCKHTDRAVYILVSMYLYIYMYICNNNEKRDYEFHSKERGGGLDTVKGMRKCCNYIIILKI